jgi:hypothetical protein
MEDGDERDRPQERLKEEQPSLVKKETIPCQREDATSSSTTVPYQTLPLEGENAQLGASSFNSDSIATNESPPNGSFAVRREAAQTVPKPV